MKKKFSLSLIMLTLCASIFVGGCSCGKDSSSPEPEKPVNPNANVILATDIALSTINVEDAVIGTPIEITYTINPSNTTDKTILIQSTDTTVATVRALATDTSSGSAEMTGTLSSTIFVDPVGVGTVNIVFTWKGTFDNDVESEDRTLTKATTVKVIGENGKETLNTPTGLNYVDGKLSWNKVAYGTDGVSAEPRYELSLTGGASPTTPVTLDTNEYNELVLTAGVEYKAKVKAKPSDEYQSFYTASAYSDEITIYKLNQVDAMTVENGVVTWNVVDRANKYIVNINGEDVETITPIAGETTVSYDTKSHLTTDVTSVEIKVKAICDDNDLVFDSEYSINNVTVHQLAKSTTFSLLSNPDGTATLSWNAVANATNYVLEIYEVGNATAIKTETIATTSYSIPADFAGNYTAKVRATGAANTLDGAYSDSYSFNRQDIAELTASLSAGVVTYSIADTHDCDIVFYIVDDEGEQTKTMTAPSGTFNVSDVTDSDSYFITARLEPRSTSNVLMSSYKKVGDSYSLSMGRGSNFTSKILWDRLDSATNYTINFTKGGSVVKSDTVDNSVSGKVEYTIPSEFVAGEYSVVVTPTIDTTFAVSDSDTFEFTKINTNELTVSYSNHVLNITSSNPDIGSVNVYVNGPTEEMITVAMGTDIDFAAKNYPSGTYTVSIQALPLDNTATNYEYSAIALASGVTINVIANPVVTSVSKTGLVTWTTDSSYASYTVYLDKGTANEVTYAGETGSTLQLNVLGLLGGAHTIYVEAIPATGYLPTDAYETFTFSKLSTVSGIRYDGTNITWDTVTGAGSYEITENGGYKRVVDTNSFAPTAEAIAMTNTYTIRPLGNDQNTISAETASEGVVNKVEAVTDLKISDGGLTWTEESDITYEMYVDENLVSDGKNYNFAGLSGDNMAMVHLIGKRSGYFDSDISNVFYVKKLGKVENVTITSTNKITYTITFNAVAGASGYIVRYNGVEYPLASNQTSLVVEGELPGGDYAITVQAISAGDTPLTESGKSYNYIHGDISEEKAFTKLSLLTDIAVVGDVLTWTDSSTAAVTNYQLQFAPDVETPTWTTQTLSDSTSCDMSFLTEGKTYLIKLRAVGNETTILSGDWSDEISITKVTRVENLKVANGAIVWDEKVSGSNAYTYDVSVYILAADGTTKIPVGETVNISDTTYEIPEMATETDYYLTVKVRNAAGIEIPSQESNPLKVVKLIAPLNFALSNHQAKWTASTSYASATYRLIITDASGVETAYDKGAGTSIFDIPDDLREKEVYKIKIMALGSVDSSSEATGYLNSDYTAELDLYKLAPITNLRLADGIVKWDLQHSDSDSYKPVDMLLLLYKDGSAESDDEEILATNVTEKDFSYLAPGTYKIEIIVRGDGFGILNSSVVVLGDSTPITKLATPTTLRMQDGVLVWNEVTTSTEVSYILFNDDVQFLTKTAGEKYFYPEADVNTVYHIKLKAVMPNSIYSGMSEAITVSKLSKVTGFTLEENKFVWDKVENASGYKLVLSYQTQAIDPDTGEPAFDPDTGDPIYTTVESTHTVEGGETTHLAIPEGIPTEYTVERIYAVGNTTADYTGRGYFTSSATELGDTFIPLAPVEGLTTREGAFVWRAVTGASYYDIKIYDEADSLIKTDSAATTSYNVTDDIAQGNYKIKVTPISTSDAYVTTNIATETTFSRLGLLDNLRIEMGYLTWNIPKSLILEAFNAGRAATPVDPGDGDAGADGGDAGAGDEGMGDESMGGEGGEDSGPKDVFDEDVMNAYLSVALGSYVENAMTSKMYPFAYFNLYMINKGNNKIVNKVIKPSYVSANSSYIIIKYFVDVEPDTWKIKVGSCGNTVHEADLESTKHVSGVMPASFIEATKLDKPLSPIHYNTTMIIDGQLVFTPLRREDNTIYTNYIIEFNPVKSGESAILYPYIVTDTTDVKNQVIDLLTISGLQRDIMYNVNVRTLGTPSSTAVAPGGELFLNSDTPATTALTILGTVAISVTNGEISWTMSSANHFEFEIQYEDGEIKQYQLPTTQTTFSLDGTDEKGNPYLPGKYNVRIKAVGDGITKISSGWTSWKTFTKLDEIPTPALNNGEFVWNNANRTLAGNGYTITIVRTRTDANGEVITEEMQSEVLPNEEFADIITYSLPDSYENFVQEGNYRSIWYYAIKVKMNGSASGGNHVNSEFCELSYAYSRLNVPSNIVVTGDRISWNQVAGAQGYQIAIAGRALDGATVDQEINNGSTNTFYLDQTFKMGIYRITIRAIGTTPGQATPASGYITSAWTSSINVVRVGEPNLRVERGEVLWNTVSSLPIEATKYVKLTINGTELPYIEDITNNIGFDFDTDTYPGDDDYEITVQFIGNSELINEEYPPDDQLTGNTLPSDPGSDPSDPGSDPADPVTSVAVATPLGEDLDGDGFDDDTGEPVDPEGGDGEGEGDGVGDDGDEPIDPQPPVNRPGFYYLSSEPVTKTFTKLAKPSINLTKVILDEGLETEKEVNAIKWAPIPSATKYDVYVSVTTTEVIPDNPETPDVDEYEEVTTTTLEIFRVEDYPELFGTIVDTEEHYFTLQDITYETYDIYIRAVGDDVAYISSTRSESIQIHIPLAPKNFKYNQQTGEITWTNTTPASHIVLGISTLNTDNMEFENETFVELNPGTTSYQLGEINEYQVRIKARLKFDNANSYDSDYSDTVLRIEFNLFASGNGTTVPYGIETEEHLNNIRYFTASNFVLKNDIVLDSYANWIIVGSADKPFTGQINGSTYTISGFNYTDGTTNIALVYSLGSESNSSASIKNLNLDINVDSKYVVRVQNFAGIAINNYGTIENIDISGNANISCTTSPANLYGGAVATNYGTINNVVNTMSIIASRGISDSTQFTMVGGVAAINEGTITRSGNSGTLKGQYVGGIVADNFKSITYSYNKGSIEALSDGFNMSVYAGGIAARNDKLTPLSDDCIIANCYAIFDSVVGSTLVVNNSGSNYAYAGGIAGQTIDGTALIKNCYAIVNTFSSTNTGEAKAGSLVANVTTTASAGYYMVLKNTYAYSNVNIFIANSNNANVNPDNVSTLGTFIRAVTSLEDSKTTVGSNIDGITINDISLLPRLSWEPV